MTVVSMVLWSAWSTFAFFLAVLFLYRANLVRGEEDQIFLDDAFNHIKAEQAALVAKVTRVEPWVRTAEWMFAAMSAIVIVYYLRDTLMQFNILH